MVLKMQLVRPLHESEAGARVASNAGWPNGAKLTIVPLIHLDHVPTLPGENPGLPPSSLSMRGPYPQIMDVHTTSQHEYGLRVGAFRVLELLDDLEIPATVALDAFSSVERLELVERLKASDIEFAAHGLDGASILSDEMDREVQRAYIQESISAVEAACGTRPTGWSGLDYAQSTTTIEDLAEHGIKWTADWPNDERPSILASAKGDILNIPISIHLDDVFAHLKRGTPIEKWATNILESVDRIIQEDLPGNRTLVLGLHPWLIGQPFRFAHLRRLLQQLRERDSLWWATGRSVYQHLHSEGKK